MTRHQRWVVWAGLLALMAVTLYPPWLSVRPVEFSESPTESGDGGGQSHPAVAVALQVVTVPDAIEYGWMNSPPANLAVQPQNGISYLRGVRLDLERLMLEWALILIGTAALWWTAQARDGR